MQKPFHEELVTRLFQVASHKPDEECCGFVLGNDDPIQGFSWPYPMFNHAKQKKKEFVFDTKSFLATKKVFGSKLYAIYHSHVGRNRFLSPHDKRLMAETKLDMVLIVPATETLWWYTPDARGPKLIARYP